MKEIKRVLKRGVFLEVSYSIPKHAAGHVRYFTFGTMREFIAMHNFKILRIFSDVVNFPGFKSAFFAKIVYTFGQHIIVFAKNSK